MFGYPFSVRRGAVYASLLIYSGWTVDPLFAWAEEPFRSDGG